MIRKVKPTDAQEICEIYNYYILNSVITFEESEVDPEEMRKRITEVTKKYPWIVNEEEGKINGYAYAGRWKERSAYRYSVENTVYVHKDHSGKGIGRELLLRLISDLKDTGIHSVIAGIALPNDASIALHEKTGFIKCGILKEVGYKMGRWVDVGYWIKILNQQG